MSVERLRMTIVGMLIDRRPGGLVADLISDAAEIEKWVTAVPQKSDLGVVRRPEQGLSPAQSRGKRIVV